MKLIKRWQTWENSYLLLGDRSDAQPHTYTWRLPQRHPHSTHNPKHACKFTYINLYTSNSSNGISAPSKTSMVAQTLILLQASLFWRRQERRWQWASGFRTLRAVLGRTAVCRVVSMKPFKKCCIFSGDIVFLVLQWDIIGLSISKFLQMTESGTQGSYSETICCHLSWLILEDTGSTFAPRNTIHSSEQEKAQDSDQGGYQKSLSMVPEWPGMSGVDNPVTGWQDFSAQWLRHIFWDRISFCNPNWPGIHCVDQASLESNM